MCVGAEGDMNGDDVVKMSLGLQNEMLKPVIPKDVLKTSPIYS